MDIDFIWNQIFDFYLSKFFIKINLEISILV